MQFPPLLALPLHVHDRATVAVVLRGSFDGLACGRAHPCPIGSVLTEPAGEPHGNRFDRGGATVLVVQPDPAHREQIEPFAASLAACAYRRDPFVLALAHRAARELTARDAVAPLALQGLVLEMLAVTARTEQAASADRHHRPPQWLEQARAILRESCSEQISVSEVAAAVGVHPVHLTRTFRAHYGTGVAAYLRSLRMDQAARELVATNTSIADIATAAGFYDQAHFTRSFKQQFGATPHQYRNETAI